MPESTLRGVKRDYEASKLSVQPLKLATIRTDGGTQTRAAMDDGTIADYADAYSDGQTLPPPVVFRDDSGDWLGDGFHRVRAAGSIGLMELACEVRTGTR